MRRALRLALLALVAVTQACSSARLGGLKTQILDRPKTYELSFRGQDAFLAGTLQQAAIEDLRDFESSGFRRASVDDAAFAIRVFYRDQGFPFAEVTYELEKPEEGKPRVTFFVEEGPRCILDKVHFQGNRAFSAKDLAALIGGPTTSILGLGKLYYLESQASGARTAMEDLYLENGYLDVDVSEPEVTFNEDRTEAELLYEVDEGPAFRLTAIEIENLEGAHLEEVRARTRSFLDRPFFPRLSYEVGAAVAEHFSILGYPDAAFESRTEIDEATGEVALYLSVDPGVQVRIGSIVVKGNDTTRETFILKRLGLVPGDVFNRALVRRAFSDLYESGVFDSVQIELVGTGPERDLHVILEEADTLKVSGEVGYGAYERARVIVGITEENLAGTGRSLSLLGKLATRATAARLTYTDPWTISKDNILGASAFYETREEVSFDRKEIGAGTNITHLNSRRFRNVLGYEYRVSDARNIAVEIPGDEIDEGQNAYISEVYWTSIYDSRDSIFLPTGGTWLRGQLEFAPKQLASQLQFTRLNARIARYHPLTEDSLVAWTAHGGIIVPVQLTDAIPLQERYFNGGQNTVRSFREGELGPKDANGNPVGGEAYTVFSVELRQKLVGSFSGALFFDLGNVTLRHQDFLDFAGYRSAVGPGIRWLLPVGPLRLDWGINPNPQEYERKWVLQFSVGVAF